MKENLEIKEIDSHKLIFIHQNQRKPFAYRKFVVKFIFFPIERKEFIVYLLSEIICITINKL
jgi:hypothetical protein